MPMFYVKKLSSKNKSGYPMCEIYYDGEYNWIINPLPEEMDVTKLTKIDGEFSYSPTGIIKESDGKLIVVNRLLGDGK